MEVTKPKNPDRIAAGKRTAEMNRKRKEDLLRNHETVPLQVDLGTDSVPIGGGDSWKYGGAIAIAVGIAIFFFWRRDSLSGTQPAVQQPKNNIFRIN